MRIVIGHLFYDLLNLYGESGNILALKSALESQDIDVEVKQISLRDSFDLDELDLIYIGAGTENSQMKSLEYLKKYASDISQAIMNNKFFLVTGNSIELFGKYILDEKTKYDALSVFDYYTERTNTKLVSECIFNYDKLEETLLGFENHKGIIKNVTNPLFTMVKGYGNDLDSKEEGFIQNNFYATHLIGPILVRNPKLLELLCKDLIKTKEPDFNFKLFDFELEQKAHDLYIQNKYKKDLA